MHFSPLDDQPENAKRKIALPQFQRSNPRHGTKFLVANVEMRRIVIVEVHRDHDSEEAADFRHGCAPTDYPVLASWCGAFLLILEGCGCGPPGKTSRRARFHDAVHRPLEEALFQVGSIIRSNSSSKIAQMPIRTRC